MPSDIPTPSRTEAAAAGAPAVTLAPKVRVALGRFRVVSLIESVALLILVVLMVIRYVFDGGNIAPFWPPIHGVIFFGYFLLTLDLGYKARWSPLGTLGIIVAGCIPFLSFWAERKVHTSVLAGRKL